MTGNEQPDGGKPPSPAGSNSFSYDFGLSVKFAIGALSIFLISLIVGITCDGTTGDVARNALSPFFALAFGGFAADSYYRKEGEKKVQDKVRLAAYTTLSIQYALERAHEPIRESLVEAYAVGSANQVGHMRAAEMALHLALGASYQAIHELNSLAVDAAVVGAVKTAFEENSAAIDSTRPRVRLGEGRSDSKVNKKEPEPKEDSQSENP